MNEGTARQQITEKIKNSTNILVTVSRDPSVDELSAALGLTLMLNKMNKHATAVFSGAVPPAITFLDPEKTFEDSVDSLRDFIIALDKEKADHLRYKVEGDVVKIFITPYRTTITADDLEFSQGDYNVELVMGLGVTNQDSLDKALEAHGRILHDAIVATVSAGGGKSALGSIGWRDDNASSLCEMLVGLSDSLKSDKNLLDEQIATAYLTGIVAATDRFSNNKTSAKVMTIAAQLMAAGANQQLIAAKLEEASEITPEDETPSVDDSGKTGANPDGTTNLNEGQSTNLKAESTEQMTEGAKPETTQADGSLVISHEPRGNVDEVAEEVERRRQEEAAKRAEEELSRQSELIQPVPDEAHAERQLSEGLSQVTNQAGVPSVADLRSDLAAASAEVDAAADEVGETGSVGKTGARPKLSGAVSSEVWKAPPKPEEEPFLGGTLNATTEQAAEDARREQEDQRNRIILSHEGDETATAASPGSNEPIFPTPPFNAASEPSPEEPTINPLMETEKSRAGESVSPVSSTPAPEQAKPVEPQQPAETLADLDKKLRAPHEEARQAVEEAYKSAPPIGGVLPLPDFSTLPPLPQGLDNQLPPDNLAKTAPATQPDQKPADPGQFRIPGQS